jgi:GntR family transcriptional regulator of arabinose operon
MASTPKHRQIYEQLHRSISTGEYGPGERLPSEAELGKDFDTSRITVAKAVNELQKQGLVSRRPGSGTYVLSRATKTGHVFGLLIPDLGRTEIFEPICHGMMCSPLASSHSLLWGHATGVAGMQEQEAEQLCHHYIAQKVSGVFFAALEYVPKKDLINRRIMLALEKAKIPIVLLDRCVVPYPERSAHDLVGTDNRRIGFMITTHLLKLGLKRIAHLAKPFSAPTVEARIAGWREAHFRYGVPVLNGMERHGDPEDATFVERFLKEMKPEGFVCGNDLTAAKLMKTLSCLGVKVPEEIRIVGIDDAKYAAMLPVPLTTQHQSCGDIGSMAMAVMLDRLAQPGMPTRDIFLQTHTVVRESCGAKLGPVPAEH